MIFVVGFFQRFCYLEEVPMHRCGTHRQYSKVKCSHHGIERASGRYDHRPTLIMKLPDPVPYLWVVFPVIVHSAQVSIHSMNCTTMELTLHVRSRKDGKC